MNFIIEVVVADRFHCMYSNPQSRNIWANRRLFSLSGHTIVMQSITSISKGLPPSITQNLWWLYVIFTQRTIFREVQHIFSVARTFMMPSKYFPHYWRFVTGTHRWPVASRTKVQWCGPLALSYMLARTNCWTDAVEQIVELLVIWDAMTLMWSHFNDVPRHPLEPTLYFLNNRMHALWVFVDHICTQAAQCTQSQQLQCTTHRRGESFEESVVKVQCRGNLQ